MVKRSSPVPGVPYADTLLGVRGAWWRVVVALVASAVALFVTSFVAMFAMYLSRLAFDPGYDLSFDDGIDAGEILGLNLGLAAMILVAAGLVRLLYGVRPRWLSSHRPGLRWWWLGVCLLPTIAVWAIQWGLGGLGAYLERDEPIGIGLLGFMVAVFLTTPLQAAGEEYVFRGLLLQGLRATRMPVWAACVVSALLFAAAHLQFDPALIADRALLGVALAYLTVKTGGLEAAIAIHSVFNISTFIVVGLLGETAEALDPEGASWLAPAIHAVMLAIVVPWILFLYKRRRARLDPAAGAAPGDIGWQPSDGAPPGWPQPVWSGAPSGSPPGWQPPYGPPPGWQQPGPPPGQYGPPPGWQQPGPPPGQYGPPPGQYGPPPGWYPPPQPPPGWQQPGPPVGHDEPPSAGPPPHRPDETESSDEAR